MTTATPSAPFANIYHHRLVAASASKPCMICHKPSTSVLITPDNKDFFYTCPGHLSDRGFAIPVVDPEAAERQKKKEDLDRAVAEVKREWEEKQKKRLVDKKKKSKDEKDEEKDTAARKDADDDAADSKAKDDKIASLEKNAAAAAAAPAKDEPRIYNLHKSVYQMRVNRTRAAQRAKRDAETMRSHPAASFPAVPRGVP